MAKKRKSIFDTPTSSDEINQVAKDVQAKTIEDIPVKNEPSKPKGNEKPKILYVDGEHHKQAKLNATNRNMKLGEYIEWLIDQDKKSL